jgi:hypothetical protein
MMQSNPLLGVVYHWLVIVMLPCLVGSTCIIGWGNRISEKAVESKSQFPAAPDRTSESGSRQ